MDQKTPGFEEIFHAALEIESPAEREEFLLAQCGDDSQLLSELKAMLASHKELGSFLDKLPVDVQETIIGQAEEDLAASLEAGLAPTFGEEAAVVIGNAGHSVLKSLGQSIDVPHVALREPKAKGEDPLVRPKSSEMPDRNFDSRYQLQGEIARGGMGAIIKGRDIDLGRDLAIKVLLDSHKGKPEVIQRFVEEAQIGGQLQHPGIAPIYELGQFADKRPFFSMKLVKGQTLAKLLAEREEAADERGKFIGIFEQVCQTMAYAHSRGVIHRDLKPANIMVGAFGEVQVMDWGLAKVLPAGGVADEKTSRMKSEGHSIIQTLRSGVGSDAPAVGSVGSAGSHTQMGSVMGTPAYMPPEQALGEIDNLDERADVFGLAAILCEILTGQPPYVAEDGTQVYRMASRGKLEDCFSRLDNCGADSELIVLAKHGLELEPKDRPRDAGAFAERVAGYLESVETKLRQTELERASEATRVVEQKKRLRVTLALAVSVMVIVVGSGGVAWWQSKQADARRLADERAATEMARLEGEQKVERAKRVAEDAARRTRNGTEVSALLDQAEEALKSGDTAKAKVALDLATTRSEDSGAEAYAERLDQRKKDLILVQALDAVDRFRWTRIVNEYPRPAMVSSRMKEAFRQFDVDLDTMTAEEAAERLSVSVAPGRIVPALDFLLVAQEQVILFGSNLNLSTQSTSTKLRDLLRLIDGDSFRDQVRDALVENNLKRLGELMNQEEALQQPPNFITLMGTDFARSLERKHQLLMVAMTQSPADLTLLMNLVTNSDQQGMTDEAIRWAQAAVAADPDNVSALNFMGALLAERGDLIGAEAFLRKAIEFDPDFAGALVNLGCMHEKNGNSDEAIACCRKAIELDPNNSLAHRNLGVLHCQQGQIDKAVSAYRKAIEIEPDNAEYHRYLGTVLIDNNLDLDEGLAHILKAIELDPKDAEAYAWLGESRTRQAKPDEALAAFRKAVELDPKYVDAYLRIAKVIFDHKRNFAEAVDACRKAIEIAPDSVEAHMSLGHALDGNGDKSAAIAAFRKAVELAPNLARAHLNLGTTLEGEDDAEMILCYRKAIELDPNYLLAYFGLALILRQTGDPEGGIEVLRKALEIAPNNANVQSSVGCALCDNGDLDEGIAYLRKAIELAPNDASPYYNLGVALGQQGKFHESRSAFQRSYELGIEPSAAAVEWAEQMIAVEANFPSYLKGEYTPPDSGDRIRLANVARFKGSFQVATRLAIEAFTDEPKLAEDLNEGFRYKAACSAARAAEGLEAEELPDSKVSAAELRGQALEWLKADLALWNKRLESGERADRIAVKLMLLRWQKDFALTSIREEAALEKLPADEQQAFKQLWSDVGASLEESKK